MVVTYFMRVMNFIHILYSIQDTYIISCIVKCHVANVRCQVPLSSVKCTEPSVKLQEHEEDEYIWTCFGLEMC